MQEIKEPETEPRFCPECFHQMKIYGTSIGKRKQGKVRRWLCPACFRTSVKPLSADDVLQRQNQQEAADAAKIG